MVRGCHMPKINQLLTFFILFTFTFYVNAEDFSLTNIQLLWGKGFNDPITGNDTVDEKMSTITLEHYGTWSKGDNYFFVDFTSGDFKSGKKHRIYAEYAPRLKLFDYSKKSFVKSSYLAGQVEHGDDFHAFLGGVGFDLRIPRFKVAELDIYLRDDNFNDKTFQVTWVWNVPFKLGHTDMSFLGFLDVSGTDQLGTDIITHPKIEMDLYSLFNKKSKNVYLGYELWYHDNKISDMKASQIYFKWIW